MKKELINFPYLTKPISLYTLDNGHKVALAHKEGALVNISSWVKTGSINEDDVNNGVSHFLEHLMFKGTERFKAGDFDRIMEQKGGIINAATWKDYTFYYITISKKHLDLALDMHSDMMMNITLPEEEIGPAFDIAGVAPEEKRERYVVLEEIKMRKDQNWSKVYHALNDMMYEKHPYKRDVIGTSEIISQIPRSAIMDYYNSFYTPENISTIVTGDFDEEHVLQEIIKGFKFRNNKAKVVPHGDMELEIKNPRTEIQRGDVNCGYIMFGFLADSAKNLKESIALDIISTILGEGKSSRLYVNLIEKSAEPYYFSLDTCHYQFKEGNNFFVEANFDHTKFEKVIPEIKNELKNIQNITEDELKKAKKQTKVGFASSTETVAKLGDSIGHYLTVCEDLNMAQNYEKLLEEIDTQYIQEIAKKYLDPEKCAINVLLPNEEK